MSEQPPRRLFDGVSSAVLGLCTTAICAGAGIVWSGLQNVSMMQVDQGRQLSHVAQTIGELKSAAERDRQRLDAYMPRTEVESKLDVLRTTTTEHARRLDRVEGRR